MATFDDKILGEKLHYYCSSSEDEGDDEKEPEDGKNEQLSSIKGSADLTPELEPWDGTSANTGPKGVLRDWQRYKQLEHQQNKDNEREKIMLAKKLALTCQSHLDEEEEKKKLEDEDDVDSLIDQQILQQFIQKRMEEMMSLKEIASGKKFGTLIHLMTSQDFLQAIDKEESQVTVIVHLYDKGIEGCIAMNGCLQVLASEYPGTKFCKLEASTAGLSDRFKDFGLPALLVYKSGNLMGNFVRLVDEFGDDFFATDIESFLIEHGMLQDASLVPSTIKSSLESKIG